MEPRNSNSLNKLSDVSIEHEVLRVCTDQGGKHQTELEQSAA